MGINNEFVSTYVYTYVKNSFFGGHIGLRQYDVTAREFRWSYRIPRSI